MKSTTESLLWQNALLPLGSTIQQALLSLERSTARIVLVVGEGNRLVGSLTDGDIRRAFLRGFKLDSLVDDLAHRSPLAVPPDMSRDLVLQIMRINKIHQIPIVNQEGSVLGLHLWESITTPEAMANMMLIMAGGQGNRLRPHTENCPKPMLKVAGKPILQRIIEKAKSEGFQKFVISLHYLGQMIEEHFRDGSKYGVSIDYLRENAPLGTAGCLSLLPQIPELPFIVTNGDVLTDLQYGELLRYHTRNRSSATMAVRQHEIQNQFGVVRTNGLEIAGFEEKPVHRSFVNAGIYALEPCVLKHLEEQQYCDMPTLFERIKQNSEKTIVYPMHEHWLDVGRPEDLLEANSGMSG